MPGEYLAALRAADASESVLVRGRRPRRAGGALPGRGHRDRLAAPGEHGVRQAGIAGHPGGRGRRAVGGPGREDGVAETARAGRRRDHASPHDTEKELLMNYSDRTDQTTSTMDLQELAERAIKIHDLYAELNRRDRGRGWTREEFMLGFVGDIGDLAKLVMAQEGAREMPGGREALEHELGRLPVVSPDSGSSLSRQPRSRVHPHHGRARPVDIREALCLGANSARPRTHDETHVRTNCRRG